MQSLLKAPYILRNIHIMIVAILSVYFAGCANEKVQYVDIRDSNKYTSAGLDYHDIEAAAHKSVQSLLRSQYILSLDPTRKKVLAISDVINDTMQQVNVQSLTMNITRTMRNSGKFQLTGAIAGSGGMSDNMIKHARNLRENEEFNQYTTAEKGALIAPELSLSGKIVQKNTRVGKQQRIDYSFILQLVDIKTGIVQWDEETNIIKVASNKKVTW
ncbi:penicillin-binding protein activator LpoB [Helicobacter aurati]|uniref:Penicillin-binding protein activator LpoB n=1 Tax=Helicobacter aurati TaxID=137778 RepID=A0A3D8J146_9HELI|nr:penicillin-binding protein activator LpoB [Helicobacter aurati]RDU71237.1 penicillin-binding protein activator LpoB [Helicobacter aurati]